MWNQMQTDAYSGMLSETISMAGHNGDYIRAYCSRPLGEGPFPGVILIPHMPGWDEFYWETTRRFSQHGYLAVCPNIFERFGHGTPEEVAGKARAAGGVRDETVMGDIKGAIKLIKSMSNSNKKVGVVGTCSGGRHAYLAACTVDGLDAAVDLWGGGVVAKKEDATPSRPVAPIEFTEKLSIPLLGIFGNDDHSPPPDQVDIHEEELKKFGKDYEFRRYDGAGHGFWYYQSPAYRPEQAMDSWGKVLEFCSKHLGKGS